MRGRIDRKGFLRLLTAAVGGAVAARADPVRAAEVDRRTGVQTQEHGYYRTVAGPYCAPDGQAYEYQCYVNCSAAGCEIWWCSWYIVGTC